MEMNGAVAGMRDQHSRYEGFVVFSWVVVWCCGGGGSGGKNGEILAW